MNIKLPNLIKRIFDLGSYSKPLLNYLMESNIDISLKHYLKSLEFIWNREYNKALNEVNLGIKKCKNNKSLYYALLSNKFIVFYSLKDIDNLEYLYYRLRREYIKIPPSIRKIVTQCLINYSPLINDVYLPKSRFWSKVNILSPSTKLFLVIGKARRKVKEGKILEGIEFYQKGVKLALKIPHPSGLITCLNDSSWYLKDINILKSFYNANKCMNYLGYYYEEPKKYFYALDTFFEVQKLFKHYRIFETIELISQFKDDEFVRDRYKRLLEESSRYNVNLEKSLYRLTQDLIKFLKKNIKSVNSASKFTGISRSKLTNIIKGKVENIRGETIRKIIKGLNIKFDISLPLEFFSEIIKMNIDNEVKSIRKLLRKRGKGDIEKLLLSTYMSLYKRDKLFNYLTKKNVLNRIFHLVNEDIDSLILFLEKNYETKRFLLYLFNPPPFIEGRKKLIIKFLNDLDGDLFKDFLNFYLKIDEKKRSLLDIFIRNYVRFSKISLNMKFKSKYLDVSSTLFDTSSIPYALSIYYLGKWDRIKILRLLNKFETSKSLIRSK